MSEKKILYCQAKITKNVASFINANKKIYNNIYYSYNNYNFNKLKEEQIDQIGINNIKKSELINIPTDPVGKTLLYNKIIYPNQIFDWPNQNYIDKFAKKSIVKVITITNFYLKNLQKENQNYIFYENFLYLLKQVEKDLVENTIINDDFIQKFVNKYSTIYKNVKHNDDLSDLIKNILFRAYKVLDKPTYLKNILNDIYNIDNIDTIDTNIQVLNVFIKEKILDKYFIPDLNKLVTNKNKESTLDTNYEDLEWIYLYEYKSDESFFNRLSSSLEKFYNVAGVYADTANAIYIACDLLKYDNLENFKKTVLSESGLIDAGLDIISKPSLKQFSFDCIVDWEQDDIWAIEFLLKAGAKVNIIPCQDEYKLINVYEWKILLEEKIKQSKYEKNFKFDESSKILSKVNLDTILLQLGEGNDTWNKIKNQIEFETKQTTYGPNGPKEYGPKEYGPIDRKEEINKLYDNAVLFYKKRFEKEKSEQKDRRTHEWGGKKTRKRKNKKCKHTNKHKKPAKLHKSRVIRKKNKKTRKHH